MEQVAQEHPFTNPPVETLRITGTSGRYSKGGATNLDNGIDLHSGQGMRVALGTASPKRPGAEAAPGTVSPKRPGAEAAPGTTSPKQPGAEEVAVLEGMPDGGKAVQALHAIRAKNRWPAARARRGRCGWETSWQLLLGRGPPGRGGGVASGHVKCSQRRAPHERRGGECVHNGRTRGQGRSDGRGTSRVPARKARPPTTKDRARHDPAPTKGAAWHARRTT